MTVLSEHILEEIRDLPSKFPQPRSAVMPALDLAQEELGHLTPEAMTEVAQVLRQVVGLGRPAEAKETRPGIRIEKRPNFLKIAC